MPRRVALSVLFAAVVCGTLTPAVAQNSQVIDWIPEDFAGFIQVDVRDQALALETVNIAAFTASILQPTRVAFEGAADFSAYFPLDSLDIENPDFNALFSGWLGDSIIIAYPALDETYSSTQPLAIFETRDSFRAAADLSPVIRAQDFLNPVQRDDVTVYAGDQVALAFTSAAVLLGATEDVQRMLDVRSGAEAALTATSGYQSVRGQLPANPSVFAFVQGDAAANAASFVLSQGTAAPLLSAFGTALSERSPFSPAAALSSGSVDAAGFTIETDGIVDRMLQIEVAVHLSGADEHVSLTAADQALLAFIPRSAMLVQSGGDASKASSFVLTALPLVNFAGIGLAGFPVSVNSAVSSGLLPAPGSEDIRSAIAGFETTLQSAVNLSLNDDILAYLTGGYAAALIPRPNNPLPVFNSTVDGLIVVQSDQADELLTSLQTLTEALTGQTLTADERDGVRLFTLIDPQSGEALLQFAALDDVMIGGTGNAVDASLHAASGDNRLIDESRWQEISGDDVPGWYFDINAIYNLIAPAAGGQTVIPVPQVIIRESMATGDILQFSLTARIAAS